MPGIVTSWMRPKTACPSSAAGPRDRAIGRSPRLTATIVASSTIPAGSRHIGKSANESAPIRKNSSRAGILRVKLPQRVDGKAPPCAGQFHPVDRELRMAGDREFEHLGPLVAR